LKRLGNICTGGFVNELQVVFNLSPELILTLFSRLLSRL
jgi:hypothetical protein